MERYTSYKKMDLSIDTFLYELRKEWNWQLEDNSPISQQFKFDTIKIEVVNPLYYKFLSEIEYDSKLIECQKKEDKYLVKSKALILKVFDIDSDDFQMPNILRKFVSELAKQIKWQSKQVSINENNTLSLITKRSYSNPSILTNFYEEPYSIINRRYYNNLIKWEHIQLANENINNDISPPIYESILMDALESVYQNDPRKTIIYSAIASEAMFSTILNDLYLELINNNDSRLKLVEIKTKTGTIKTDPIYNNLNKSNQFKLYLHERQIYLKGKSIFLENNQLYQEAIKLYRTRNKIVHVGEPIQNSSDFLPINIVGARKAYNTAIKLFNWMGITEYNQLDASNITRK